MSYLYIIPVSDNIYNITESGNITQHLLQLDKYCPNYSKENKYTQFKLIRNYKEIQNLIKTDEDINFLHLINTKFNKNCIKDRWYNLNNDEKNNLINFISEYIEPLDGCIITEDSKYKCSTCNKIYETSKALKRHSSSCNSKQIYNCDICNRKFNSNQCFRNHTSKCKSLVCSVCNKELSCKHSFELHTKNCGNFKCEKCGNTFNSRYKYISHCSKIHGFTPIV